MKLSIIVLALGVTFSGSAFATTEQWDLAAPWGSQTTAQYAEWSSFSAAALTASGDTTPAPGLSNSAASIKSNGGTVTGGGNIYGFFDVPTFTATLSGTTSGIFDVYLRAATQGTAVATSATLNGAAGAYTLAYTAGSGMAVEQEVYWKWTNVAASSLYTFVFNASGAHTSLDQLALATVAVTAVPEPEAYSMMALGLGLLAFVARRSTKNKA